MIAVVLALSIAFAFGGVVFSSTTQPGAQAAENSWVKAFKANDLGGVMATYAPDAVAWFSGEGELRGAAAIRNSYKNYFDSYRVTDFAVLKSDYRTVGSTSVGWGTYRST